jgi:hypothetical protein
MFFSLLLACSAAPLAPQTQRVAADYFPADTLAVVEFSLEAWDRLRHKTIAYELLNEGKILRTAADQLQKVLSDGHSLPKGFDLRQLAASTRFYLGVAGKSLPWGTVVIGFDETTLHSAATDPTVLLDAYNVPWRRIGKSVIGIFAIPGTSVPNEIQIGEILDQLQARGEGKVDEATLGDSPNWQKMRQMLASSDRIYGLWVPSDTWSAEGFWHLLPPELKGDPKVAKFVQPIIEIVVASFELEKFDGLAVSAEVVPPFIQDKMLLLGEGAILGMFRFEPKGESILDQLAQCDAEVATASVMKADIHLYAKSVQNLASGMIDLAESMFGAQFDEFQESSAEIKLRLAQAVELCAYLGPSVALETGEDSFFLGQVDRIQLEVRDRQQLAAAWLNFDQGVKGFLQLMAMQSGVSLEQMQLEQDRWIYQRPGIFVGEGTLGETSDFQTTVARLKEMSAGNAILSAGYYSKDIQARALEELLAYAQSGAKQLGFKLAPGFRKLLKRQNFASKTVAGGVISFQVEGGLISQGFSATGLAILSLPQMIGNALQQIGAGAPIQNLDEEEF